MQSSGCGLLFEARRSASFKLYCNDTRAVSSDTCKLPNTLAQAVKFLTSIREVCGSNLGWDAGYYE
jgi:hypothetical protein